MRAGRQGTTVVAKGPGDPYAPGVGESGAASGLAPPKAPGTPGAAAAGANPTPATPIAPTAASPAAAARAAAGEIPKAPEEEGPVYDGNPLPKDDGRADEKTVPVPPNPDRNPDPKGNPFYTPPPPEPPVVNQTAPAPAKKKKEEKKRPEMPKYKGAKMKRKYKEMTLSKLTGDNDTWVENNDKYQYRNMKMHTTRMIQNKTYGGMYYVRMSVGSPPQIQEMMVDTASSWSYLDTYDSSDDDRTPNYYTLSEERDGSLDCGPAETVTIGNGRGRGVTGPACYDVISPQGGPQIYAHMPIVLNRHQDGDGPYAGGILGLGPVDESGHGASFVEYLFDQEKIDRNLFAVMPGKNPKITFGTYQEEGLPGH
jgi:hypothetical protein